MAVQGHPRSFIQIIQASIENVRSCSMVLSCSVSELCQLKCRNLRHSTLNPSCNVTCHAVAVPWSPLQPSRSRRLSLSRGTWLLWTPALPEHLLRRHRVNNLLPTLTVRRRPSSSDALCVAVVTDVQGGPKTGLFMAVDNSATVSGSLLLLLLWKG